MTANKTRRIQPMPMRYPVRERDKETWAILSHLRGFDPGAADGKFAPHSRAAGVAFFNFPTESDGEVGPQAAALGIPV